MQILVLILIENFEFWVGNSNSADTVYVYDDYTLEKTDI